MTQSEEDRDKKMQKTLQGIEQELKAIQAGKISKQSQKKHSSRGNRTFKKTKKKFNQEKSMNSMKKRSSKKRRPQNTHKGTHKGSHHKKSSKNKLRIIPLGGLEEIGKNMMVFEYGNDIVIVDMGFQFPTEDMLGIDYVIPDSTYLQKRKKNIRGVFLTHGHLDHIGGLAYILPKLGFPPVYGTPLTIGLVKKQLQEFKLLDQVKLHTFDPKERFKAGVFGVSFFRVNHSIPDAVSIVLETPMGRLVHTGDFKFDKTPHDQKPADLNAIKAVGKKGVLALISDSTNALEPGHTTSEKVIAATLDRIIGNTKGRLIVASFSSLIGRLQQIMDSAVRHNRKIFISGRSMITNVRIAQELGYIKVPKGVIIDIRKMKKYKDSQIIALTTGSQGENFAALARIATDDHAHVRIKKDDTVVLSSSPIIGNETAIVKVINLLCKRGAKIITSKDLAVHTSGHAKQEELKMMINMIRPKYFIPEHGDFYMRSRHAELAQSCGISESRILLLDNGDVAEITAPGQMKKAKEKVPVGHVMVEGPERSEVGNDVLMDRQLMAENGVLMVVFKVNKRSKQLIGKPRVESEGFVYADSSAQVLNEIKSAAEKSYKAYLDTHKSRASEKGLVEFVRQNLDRLLVRMLDKRPLVIPILIKA